MSRDLLLLMCAYCVLDRRLIDLRSENRRRTLDAISDAMTAHPEYKFSRSWHMLHEYRPSFRGSLLC